MAHVGHPLLGDDKYGVKTTNRSYKEKRQLLCSAEVSCDFGKEAGPLSYLAGTRWTVGDVGFVREILRGKVTGIFFGLPFTAHFKINIW